MVMVQRILVNLYSAEIVCNQPNLSRKMFVISQILPEFISLRDNLANQIISQIFFQPSVFIADWGLVYQQ